VDFAQLIKVYRARRKGESRYSPAEVVSTEIVPVIGSPDPAPRLHVPRGAPKSNHEDADSQVDAVNERLQQEVGEPLGCALPSFRVVQLRARASLIARDSPSGSGDR